MELNYFDSRNDFMDETWAGSAESAYALASDRVRTMHADTGLWERISSDASVDLTSVDEALLAHFTGYCPEPRSVQFAGNSVRFDANWVDLHLPLTTAHVHYRIMDVTCLTQTLQRFGMVDEAKAPEFAGSEHNALNGIRHAIDTYRWLRTACHQQR